MLFAAIFAKRVGAGAAPCAPNRHRQMFSLGNSSDNNYSLTIQSRAAPTQFFPSHPCPPAKAPRSRPAQRMVAEAPSGAPGFLYHSSIGCLACCTARRLVGGPTGSLRSLRAATNARLELHRTAQSHQPGPKGRSLPGCRRRSCAHSRPGERDDCARADQRSADRRPAADGALSSPCPT